MNKWNKLPDIAPLFLFLIIRQISYKESVKEYPPSPAGSPGCGGCGHLWRPPYWHHRTPAWRCWPCCWSCWWRWSPQGCSAGENSRVGPPQHRGADGVSKEEKIILFSKYFLVLRRESAKPPGWRELGGRGEGCSSRGRNWTGGCGVRGWSPSRAAGSPPPPGPHSRAGPRPRLPGQSRRSWLVYCVACDAGAAAVPPGELELWTSSAGWGAPPWTSGGCTQSWALGAPGWSCSEGGRGERRERGGVWGVSSSVWLTNCWLTDTFCTERERGQTLLSEKIQTPSSH